LDLISLNVNNTVRYEFAQLIIRITALDVNAAGALADNRRLATQIKPGSVYSQGDLWQLDYAPAWGAGLH
jgi:hypothetical protein